VAVHHLELHGFETGTSVCTFRSTRLAGWQQAAIEEVHLVRVRVGLGQQAAFEEVHALISTEA